MSSYLVQYGKSAFLGWFEASADFSRGDRVVIRGPRGLDIGTILCESGLDQPDAPDGDIIRLAALADAAQSERNEARAAEILAAAVDEVLADGLPLAFVDIELSLDAAAAILHALPWAECDATSLLDRLSARFGLVVHLFDLSRSPTAADPPATGCGKPGCGKPGCGSESGGGCDSCGSGGGCSSGSCSRGHVKSAADLTAYFAELRRNMESRTPLA